jgi:hypothetical protein
MNFFPRNPFPRKNKYTHLFIILKKEILEEKVADIKEALKNNQHKATKINLPETGYPKLDKKTQTLFICSIDSLIWKNTTNNIDYCINKKKGKSIDENATTVSDSEDQDNEDSKTVHIKKCG